jgi:hypothetical protein
MTAADVPVPRATTVTAALGGLAVPGIASLGAGAIHAAAIGVHNEHRQAVLAFALVAAVQLGWGALALTRTGPFVAIAGVAGNAVALVGWVLAKTTGITMIEGLEEVEAVQLADGAAAGLALASVLLVLIRPGRGRGSGRVAVAVAVTALTIPSMISAGSHAHAGDHHDEAATASTAEHEPGPPVPPKPYDPSQPIDLSGVPGVTPEQQARAENLIAVTLLRLPQFSDPLVAEAAGYRSIQDAVTGYEHFINWSYIDDDKLLDPDHPESLVYRVHRDGRRELQAAMYMLTTKDTLDTVPDVGGALTQWHIHDNLCFTDEPGHYKVRGLTNADGTCTPPLVKPAQAPMIHVWTVKHRCGPFAALEGVGAGQIKPDETRLCDHAHGAS